MVRTTNKDEHRTLQEHTRQWYGVQIVKDGFLEEVMIELCQKRQVDHRQVKVRIVFN